MPGIISFLITNTFKGLLRAGAHINYSFANLHLFLFTVNLKVFTFSVIE